MSESSTTSDSIQVIGAGWGRTGTKSLQTALEILGLGPCYDMVEVFRNGHANFWIRVADKKEYDFEEAFNGKVKYHSTADYPSARYWKEQLERYPNAKVILTVRDPEKWYKSCCDTIFQVMPCSPMTNFGAAFSIRWLGIPTRGFDEMVDKVCSRDSFNGDWSKDSVIRSYNAHNERVLQECPKDKLLVYQVSEGWEPLCKFLGMPIPNVPFPHENDTAAFKRVILLQNIVGYTAITLGVAATAGVVWLAVKNLSSSMNVHIVGPWNLREL